MVNSEATIVYNIDMSGLSTTCDLSSGLTCKYLEIILVISKLVISTSVITTQIRLPANYSNIINITIFML